MKFYSKNKSYRKKISPPLSQIVENFSFTDCVLLWNRQFFPVVSKLLQQAKQKIYIIQYEMFYEKGKSKHQVNSLLHNLHSAKAQGVDVKILLNSAFCSKRMKLKQLRTVDYLLAIPIPVKLYKSSICLHLKVILIDDDIVILGSHNLSVTALTKNIEASVVIRSQSLSQQFIKLFDDLWISG